MCENQSTIGKWKAVNIFRVGLQAYPTEASKEGILVIFGYFWGVWGPGGSIGVQKQWLGPQMKARA